MKARSAPVGLLALLGVWCAARPEPPAPPPTDPRCDVDREALGTAMRASAARACTTDADCATVTSPKLLAQARARVVHQDDAARLDGEARALLRRCGASAIYHEGLGAYDVVTPRCKAARCTVSVTTYHVDDP